jgi:hypothetical protein
VVIAAKIGSVPFSAFVSAGAGTAVNLRLKPAMKEAAERATAAELRSLMSYIEKLIADDLQAKKAAPGLRKR